MKKILLSLILCFLFYSNGTAQTLTSLGGGVTLQGNVYAIQYDSTYNFLYIGGDMRAVNGVHVGNVARWDGSTWTAMNGGIDGAVRSMKLVNHDLYVGGLFQLAGGIAVNNVARWDGTSWHSPGSGLPYVVNTLEFFHDTLYATGYPQGGSILYLCSFNGTFWNPNIAHFDNLINGMVATDSVLLIYGNFSHANADTAYGLVSYSGASFYIYPPQFTYGIRNLALIDSSIYATNQYSSLPSHWVNGAWHTDSLLPNDEPVQSIYNYNDTLYILTDSSAGGGGVLHIKKIINGSAGPTMARMVYSINANESINLVYSSGTKLFIGSNLSHFGDSLAMGLFMYDGSNWSNPGKPSYISWMNAFSYSFINCIIKDSLSGDLIAGGWFYFAGEQYAANVARWDGIRWNAMGSGLSNRVNKLVYFNNEWYAVGYFGRSGGNWVGRIARWDGTSWQALGTGANKAIYDAIVYRNELYVGGEFDTISGIPAMYCAKYNGSTWSAVGNNVLDDPVTQLCVFNDTLIAGSKSNFYFNFPSSTKFARYSGSTWTAMSNQTINADAVTSFLIFNGQLYSSIDNTTNTGIWRWNGVGWQSLGSIGSNYTFYGRLYNFHNQLAASTINGGLYLYDGTSFNKVSDIGVLTILNESPMKDYVGGIIGSLFFGASQVEINDIGTIDFVLPQISISMNADTLCERQYEFYHALTQDAFVTIHWHFPGGLPDTLSSSWDPVIQYISPGNYSAYLVATNLVGTDTIYFSSDLTVLPCTVGTEEISSSSSITVFPNPVSSVLSIKSNVPLNEIFITDITGHLVEDWLHPNVSQFDLSRLAAGVYLLTCITDQKKQSYKIFKQ